jgi:hypothetical protein
MAMAGDVLREIDDEMRRSGIDLHAKHWVIYAERGAARPARVEASPPPGVEQAPTVSGAWDGEVTDVGMPPEMAAAIEIVVPITIANRSWRTWTSGGDRAINVSYHWLDTRRTPVDHDGMRTPLPHPLEAGATVRATVRVRTPTKPGTYILQIDLVEEAVTWFSQAGVRPYEARVRVVP